MEINFNPARSQIYFTAKFTGDHICLQSSVNKKNAENVFLRRFTTHKNHGANGRNFVSTVLCLTPQELALLAGEIHRRQEEFGRQPNEFVTTLRAYDFWARGGTKSKDRKRATLSSSRFRYKVWLDPKDGIYKMFHFHGLV